MSLESGNLSLLVLLELGNLVNRLLLRKLGRLLQVTLTVGYDVHSKIVQALHGGMELLSRLVDTLFQSAPQVNRLEQFDDLALWVSVSELAQHVVGDVNLGLDELGIDHLLNLFGFLVVGSSLSLGLIDQFEELVVSSSPHVFSDIGVVEVLQVLQRANGEHLVVSVRLALVAERIVFHVEHLQVVLELSQVFGGVVEVFHHVLAKREDVELLEVV